MAILGLEQFKKALARVARDAEQAAKLSVSKTAAVAESEAKANFEGSHKKGQPHEGGSKPNVVTGATRRSIRTDPIKRYGTADFGTIVAPRVKWSRRLELGYPAGRNAYPYFMDPARHARDQFRGIAAEQWRAFLHT